MCFCGRFEISVQGSFGDVRYCHCSQCRRKSGTAFTANAQIKSSQFRLKGPRSGLTEYEHKPGLFNAFCSHCGSPLYARNANDPEDIGVRLGGFDEPIDASITGHVWTNSKAPWYEIEGYLPRFHQAFEENESPKQTALLIIDVQNALVSGAYRAKEMLGAINLAIGKARLAGAPVIFIQHNHASFAPLMKGSDGWHLHPGLDKKTGDLVIEKRASDAFYETPLAEELNKKGVSTVVCCGMQSEYCVAATCTSALSKDLDAVLLSDGHTTGGSDSSAQSIIDHHNRTLPNLAHPRACLNVISSSEIFFNAPPPIYR
jgi:nicotinamidase-related amidase